MSRIEAEKANPGADVWFGAPSENHIIARTGISPDLYLKGRG